MPKTKAKKSVIVVPTSGSSREFFEYFLSSFKLPFDFHWEDKNNINTDVTMPCLIVCCTGSRVVDDVKRDLSDLNLTGRNAMLIVIGQCAKNVKPDRLLPEERKPDNIKCFTNILIWKDTAYKCDVNKKAYKDIMKYCSEFDQYTKPQEPNDEEQNVSPIPEV